MPILTRTRRKRDLEQYKLICYIGVCTNELSYLCCGIEKQRAVYRWILEPAERYAHTTGHLRQASHPPLIIISCL